MPDSEFLTLAEVANRLRVTTSTVRRWIAAGDLPGVKIAGTTYRVRRADVEALIERSQIGSAS